jgi:hypothetical protein
VISVTENSNKLEKPGFGRKNQLSHQLKKPQENKTIKTSMVD